MQRFQGQPPNLSTSAFLWDLQQPNEPTAELAAPSCAVSLAFNSKLTDLLLGGCYNGVVCASAPCSPVPLSFLSNAPSVGKCSKLLPATKICCSSAGVRASGLWDLRKGVKPVEISIPGNSHFDPVYDVVW